jgi:hypothetical protein
MLKSIFDFILTGISVILTYVVYFIASFVTTFVVGVPIGLGVRVVRDAVNMLYNRFMV